MTEKTTQPRLTQNNAKKESNFMLDNEIYNHLNVYLKKKLPIVLTFESNSNSFLTYLIDYNRHEITLYNSITPNLISSVQQAEQTFLTVAESTLIGGRISGDGKHLIFKPHDIIFHKNTREEERLSFNPEEKVYLEFTNPYDKITKFKKKIFDVSSSGLSFETRYDSKLFSEKQIIENMIIKAGDRQLRKCTGEVIYKKKLFDLDMRQRYQIGMKLTDIMDLTDDRE